MLDFFFCGVNFFPKQCPFKTYIKYKKENLSIVSQINFRFAALHLRSLLLSFPVIFCAPLQGCGSRSFGEIGSALEIKKRIRILIEVKIQELQRLKMEPWRLKMEFWGTLDQR
jgi:hypothetical protein